MLGKYQNREKPKTKVQISLLIKNERRDWYVQFGFMPSHDPKGTALMDMATDGTLTGVVLMD